jgi:ribonuclease P protein component
VGRPNLRLRGEIRKLFNRGRLYRGRWMTVRICDTDLSATLISVRKRFGGAVVRNRARRRLRALCRELNPQRHPGQLLLVSIRDHARGRGYRDLRIDLISAFKSLGLLDQ